MYMHSLQTNLKRSHHYGHTHTHTHTLTCNPYRYIRSCISFKHTCTRILYRHAFKCNCYGLVFRCVCYRNIFATIICRHAFACNSYKHISSCIHSIHLHTCKAYTQSFITDISQMHSLPNSFIYAFLASMLLDADKSSIEHISRCIPYRHVNFLQHKRLYFQTHLYMAVVRDIFICISCRHIFRCTLCIYTSSDASCQTHLHPHGHICKCMSYTQTHTHTHKH